MNTGLEMLLALEKGVKDFRCLCCSLVLYRRPIMVHAPGMGLNACKAKCRLDRPHHQDLAWVHLPLDYGRAPLLKHAGFISGTDWHLCSLKRHKKQSWYEYNQFQIHSKLPAMWKEMSPQQLTDCPFHVSYSWTVSKLCLEINMLWFPNLKRCNSIFTA